MIVTWSCSSQNTGVPEGSYVYGIADYGNIIAVASDKEHVEHIWWEAGCYAGFYFYSMLKLREVDALEIFLWEF